MALELKTEDNETYLKLETPDGEDYALFTWFWKYEHGFDNVKEGCEAMLEYLESNGHKKFLSDTTNFVDSWDEVNDWVVNDWYPRAIKIGLYKVAHVMSIDFFANLAADVLEEDLKSKIPEVNFKLFGDFESARSWIKGE